ncbi:MAG TPA: hypothetical protein VJ276_14335, partial [Thermoanaerobaculia bacterium]|nr:hypothetical protein [Thermoanaerobaculia bacterium]
AGVGALLALDASSRRGDVVAAVLLGVALAAGAVAIGLWTRTAGDRLQEATRFVWAGVVVCWSVALFLTAMRRARGGKLARR